METHCGRSPGAARGDACREDDSVRATSLAAWDAYARQLPRARSEALKAVVDCVGSTARELERITGDRKINARLSELEAHGLIEARSERRCTVTGHTALTWWPRESPVFRPLPPRASRAAALRKALLDLCVGREAVRTHEVLRVLGGAR